jgi:hypothetical protein
MKNLYKKLKPKYRQALNANCKRYDSAQKVKYVLMSKTIWDELSISEFKNLMLFADISVIDVSARDLLYGDTIIKQKLL